MTHDWRQLVEHLEKTNSRLAALLEHAHFLRQTPEGMHIQFTQSLYAEMFRERKQDIESALSHFTGYPLNLFETTSAGTQEIQKATQTVFQQKVQEKTEADNLRMQEARNHPSHHLAESLLGAKLREVKLIDKPITEEMKS
jgi:hypothetical protein